MKTVIEQTPVLRKPASVPGSTAYWESRYAAGGHSGVGSYGLFAEFKADVINGFVAAHHVQTVIEFGCGDGNQLLLAKYTRYVGFDVSSSAIARCQELFNSDENKLFRLLSTYNGEKADLALSLDVIYHLLEDDVFEHHMRTLFEASDRYVIIYSSDSDDNRDCKGTHVRHRKFTRWIQENFPNWKLVEHLPNKYPYRGDYLKGSSAEFFIYEKA
ncbi:MAG TPA: class I SAM-dependent methyltransferase [Thermodesulfobacteriota bacterium]|jgi:SAM-dependent methyltransferase|nr:class I SAM-dependent methyltransferase [Thermodesulfobacteriota bacterium]